MSEFDDRRLVSSLSPLDILLLDPGHAGTELATHFLDRMLLAGLEKGIVLLLATLGLCDPILGEFAGLNVLEGALHALLHRGINDFRTDNDVAILGSLGDREAHAADPRLVDHVDDQLELMENFEVGHLWLISSLDERLESGLDQGCGTAAENGLLAEEIRLRLLLESGLEDTSTGATDALGPCEGGLLGCAAFVLVDGDEGGNPLAFLILTTNGVTRSLGGNHDDVDMLRRLNRLVVDREAVAEEKGVSGMEIRSDIFFIDLGDDEVGNGHHDHIGLLDCFCGVENLEAELLGDLAAFALGVKSNDDLDAALLEVEGMGVSLGTEANHGAGFPLEELQIGIFTGVDFSRHGLVVVFWVIGMSELGVNDRLLGSGEGDLAGTGQLRDSELIHQGEELIDLAFGSGDLNGQALRLNINDLRAEDIADLHDLAARLGISLYANEHKLTVDIVGLAKILDADDVHKLVELLSDLIKNLVVPAYHNGHAGGLGVKSRPDVESIDVESASAEHAGDAG